MSGEAMTSQDQRRGATPCRVAIDAVRVEPRDLPRLVRAVDGASGTHGLATAPWGSFALGRLAAPHETLAAHGLAPGDRVAVARHEHEPADASWWQSEVSVPADAVHAVPARWTLSRAALLPEMALALRAVRACAAGAHDRVAVLGLDTAALCAVQALKIEGVRTVVAADADPAALRIAKTLGADETLAPAEFAALAGVEPDRAADRTVCFAPDNALFAHGIRGTSHLGSLVVAGAMKDEPAVIPDYYREIIIKETTLVGAQRPDAGDWQVAATILSTGILDALGDAAEIAADAMLGQRLRGLVPASLARRQAFLVFAR